MKRIIERRTNVDFCKRVEVRNYRSQYGYEVLDRYLTIPGWKLEGFTAVNPRTDTPIFGKIWGNNYEGFLSLSRARTSSCPRLRGGGIWTTSAANESSSGTETGNNTLYMAPFRWFRYGK